MGGPGRRPGRGCRHLQASPSAALRPVLRLCASRGLLARGWAPARPPQLPPSFGLSDSDRRPGFPQCIAQGPQPPLRPTLGLLPNSPQLFPLRLLFRPRAMRRGFSLQLGPISCICPRWGLFLFFVVFFRSESLFNGAFLPRH